MRPKMTTAVSQESQQEALWSELRLSAESRRGNTRPESYEVGQGLRTMYWGPWNTFPSGSCLKGDTNNQCRKHRKTAIEGTRQRVRQSAKLEKQQERLPSRNLGWMEEDLFCDVWEPNFACRQACL